MGLFIVFLYYSGHGTPGGSYQRNDNEALSLPSGQSYRERELKAQLRQFGDSTTRILVLDTCFSGGFAGLANIYPNTCVLASSRYNQSSWGQVDHLLPAGASGSVFTSWLTRAMQDDGSLGVDVNMNSRISMTEAFAYARRNIGSLTTWWQSQNPVLRPKTEEFEIILTSA